MEKVIGGLEEDLGGINYEFGIILKSIYFQ